MAYMGGYNLLVLPFLCGASVVVDHVFDARSSLNFWDKAKNNNVNTLWLAPTVLSILLRMDPAVLVRNSAAAPCGVPLWVSLHLRSR